MTARSNRIISKVESIDRLSFYPLPSRPVKAARAVKVGKAYVVIGENGRIYSSQVLTFTFWQRVERMDDTVQALIRLGMLTPQAVEQHKAAEVQERADRDRKYAAGSILDNIEAAGLTLTKVQLAKLEKLARRPGGAS